MAQIKKLNSFLETNRRNHAQLKTILSVIPEITFRRIPDPAGDSCTFLSWFLPTEEITRSVVNELKFQNILAGNFYWYDNNWHYIRKWDHLKNGVTLSSLHPDYKKNILHHTNKNFADSDAVMSRCISTAVSLLWTEEQIKEKGGKMVTAIQKILKQYSVNI